MSDKIGFLKRRFMPLSELEAYYRQQRQTNFKRNRLFHGTYWRKALHSILIVGLKIKHFVCRQKIVIVGDKRQRAEHPVIYAATHIGWDDIEMALTAIKEHAYLLFGDARNFYRNMGGFFISVNGVIYFDTNQKADRHIAKESCVRWLLGGGNLLIFPEGAWNITENQVVMKLFPGTVEMAIRGGSRYCSRCAGSVWRYMVCEHRKKY